MALTDFARARQGAYRLFSQGLLYPDEERLKLIPIVAAEMGMTGNEWYHVTQFEEWGQCLSALEGLTNREPEAIQGEYLRLFGVNRLGLPCPPYESAYVGEDGFAIGWVMARLEGEYANLSLFISPILNEPPDHVAVELEFMSYLCGQEAEAWENEVFPEALKALQLGRNFLKQHLGRWFPEFADRVATNDRDGVFIAVTKAARAFLVHDEDLVGTLLQRLQSAEGIPLEAVE